MQTAQADLTQLCNDLFPQTLGMTDTAPILGLCLLLPGALMFGLFLFNREYLRPKWRGYWDAV